MVDRQMQLVSDIIAAQAKALIVEGDQVVNKIFPELRVSQGGIFTIIHEHLDMCNVSARWSSKNFSTCNGKQQLASCCTLLELFNADPANFIACLLNGRKTWFFHRDPETNL